jgi:hypothetical protein
LTLALSAADAAALLEIRATQGFIGSRSPVMNGHGWFYLIQTVPDLDPLRVKLGFTADVKQRLNEHRTINPTAEVVKSWPSRSSWELAAIASATRDGYRRIGQEVYQCESIDAITARLDAFFSIMPKP